MEPRDLGLQTAPPSLHRQERLAISLVETFDRSMAELDGIGRLVCFHQVAGRKKHYSLNSRKLDDRHGSEGTQHDERPHLIGDLRLIVATHIPSGLPVAPHRGGTQTMVLLTTHSLTEEVTVR
jgi:hypothetical protein